MCRKENLHAIPGRACVHWRGSGCLPPTPRKLVAAFVNNLQLVEWRCASPSLQKELNLADAAFRQLDYFVSDAKDAIRWELYHYLYIESECLDDVLHNGASVEILEDGGRGWRFEVHAEDGAAVTYRRMGSCA